jgi:DNA-binding SARP family transcriptional activator
MSRTIGRLIRAVGAAVVLLVALAALPTALIVVQGAVAWDWRAMLAQPMSALTAVAAAVGVGWMVWLALVWQVLLDTIAALRGLRRRTMWLPVPLHTAVTAVAGGILLALHALRGGATISAPAGPPTATATATWDAPQPAPSDRDAPPVSPRTDPGLALPGGWLALPVAGAVAAAVALVWVHARRRYSPRPPTGWRRHDPDLVTPAASVRHLLETFRAVVDNGEPDVGPDPDDPTWSDAPPHDPDAGRTPALLDVLPIGELHLTGPGRHDAARGLLVALSAHPGGPPRIVLTADFAAALLGEPHSPTAAASASTPAAGDQHPPDPGVVVFATGAEPDAATPPVDVTPPHPGDPGSGPVPGAARCTIRIAATPGRTACWHVGRDGTVHAVTGRAPDVGRLPVLDRRTTVDILRSLGLLPNPAAAQSPEYDEGRFGHTTAAGVDLTGWPDPPPDTAGEVRRLLLQVLGEVRVLRPHPDGGYSPVLVRRSAAQQILVLLALHRDGRTDDEIQEALWPNVARSVARRRYATTMSELRRALHDAAGRPVLLHHDPAGPPADDTPRRYWLDPAAIQVDVWRLQGLLDAAAATTDRAYRRLLLAAASGMAHGEPAAGWAHEWLRADRERVVRHLLDVHTYLADLEPDDHAALRLLHQALELAPTNEHLHRRVLQRHAAAGDHNGLRRAAATLIEHLTAHNLQPEPATVTLLTTLLTDTGQPPDPPPRTSSGPDMPEGSPDDHSQR